MNDHIEMMRLAEKEALKSVCKRAQVGSVWKPALTAKGTYIISKGHNFNLNGGACECDRGKTLPDVVHAEHAAILFYGKFINNVHGGTLYVTRQPCIDCAGLIVHVGIDQVFYRDADDKTDGLELLAAHGVKVDSGWIQGQSQPLIESDLMQKIQDSWFARWPNKKQGEQHGASTVSREDQSSAAHGSGDVSARCEDK